MPRFIEGYPQQPFESSFDSHGGADTDTRYVEPLMFITPESIYAANHTPEVADNLAEWQEHKEKGELVAAWLCGDARAYIPEEVARRTASIRSLGAGGDLTRFKGVLKSNGVGAVAFFGHYNGGAFELGKAPSGCGITDEHGRLANCNEDTNYEGYGHFAKEHVKHADPVIQTVYSALEATELTDKWIAAAALDHRSGRATPVGYFRNSGGGYSTESGLNPYYFDNRHYTPQIYNKGLPAVSEEQFERMPEMLADYFIDWDNEMRELRDEYALNGTNYSDALEIQNPSIITLNTDPRPLGIRLRLGPNKAFKLRVPRESLDDEELISPKKLKQVLDQAQYPIAMNTKNFDQPGEAFSNTHTLLIETRDIDKSRGIAEVALAKPWVQKWLNLPDQRHPHQILVAQVNKGVLNAVEKFS